VTASDHLVILFGGGATRGAFSAQSPPPPLELDFFDIAGQIAGRGTRRLSARVASAVFSLFNRVTGIGLEQYFRDIETRAEIGQFAKSKNRPTDWERRQRDLEELIRRVLIHTTCELNDGPARVRASTMHARLLDKLRTGDTVLTFNYDTVIEESFPTGKSLWDPADGYGVEVSGITHAWAEAWRERHGVDARKKSSVQLLKLHGSINWTLYKTKKVRLKPRPYVVRSRKGAPVFDKCSILPPGWHKNIAVNPYRRLWREARLRLESCTSLAIIGYSLPETDFLAKALFSEATRRRATRGKFLKRLHVADPNETVKTRLVNLFLPALGAKGLLYRYSGIDEVADVWARGAVKP